VPGRFATNHFFHQSERISADKDILGGEVAPAAMGDCSTSDEREFVAVSKFAQSVFDFNRPGEHVAFDFEIERVREESFEPGDELIGSGKVAFDEESIEGPGGASGKADQPG
jgi:hypothetical protein